MLPTRITHWDGVNVLMSNVAHSRSLFNVSSSLSQLHVRGRQECVEEVEETIPGSGSGETPFSLSAVTDLQTFQHFMK